MPEPLPNSINEPLTPQATSEGEKTTSSPDYGGLVRFLVEPLLETPDTLRVDCELLASVPKVWIRMAFEDPEKGRVFGRGGRNMHAVRTILEAAAKDAGQSIYLDIYGGWPSDRSTSSEIPASKPTVSPALRNGPVRAAPKRPDRA
jgi:uncharacterized protein